MLTAQRKGYHVRGTLARALCHSLPYASWLETKPCAVMNEDDVVLRMRRHRAYGELSGRMRVLWGLSFSSAFTTLLEDIHLMATCESLGSDTPEETSKDRPPSTCVRHSPRSRINPSHHPTTSFLRPATSHLDIRPRPVLPNIPLCSRV